MKRAIWGAVFNVCSRTLLVSPPLRTFRSGPLLSRFSVLTLRCYSSGNDKYNGLNSTTNENKDSLVEDDVSTEELKSKINKFYEGDVDSLPTIFEAILKRKLSGKHEDDDDELMKEIRERMPGQVEDFKDEESGSDLSELNETDEETEDSSDYEEEDRRI
ncbi:unnamed protein product [Citrullus colocynthis]|uniref:Uncharacterized protein n=1 Tax=Citrullus colocynthis TaxID=252529 RepID=A0ABP0XYY8_9ROSI